MTPAKAKKVADKANYFFYWDYSLRMYACYPQDLSEEASYHTKNTLEGMTPESFAERYLTEGKPRLED